MTLREDEICFMVSLYGTAIEPADMIPLIGDVDAFFTDAGQPCTHLSVTAPGFGKRPLRFDKAWQRLQKTAPGAVQHVNAVSFIEGWEDQLNDWNAFSGIYQRFSCFQIGAGLASMPNAEQQIADFVRRSLPRIRPSYGIGFWRRRGLGPSLYGIGLSYGYRAYSGPEYEESVAVSRWGDAMRDAVWNHGALRDVYPYNLLNEQQLAWDVGGCSLEAWIRAGRGTLTRCAQEYALWTVAPHDILAIRRELAPSGVVFSRPPKG